MGYRINTNSGVATFNGSPLPVSLPSNTVTAGVPLDVTGSRVAGNPGTVYENTTGAPLRVIASGSVAASTSSFLRLFIGSTNNPGTMTYIDYVGNEGSGSADNATATVQGIVPVDYFYRVEAFGGASVAQWLEQQ